MRKAARIRGGLLIGDALGVPFEFHEPEELPPTDRIDYEPPSDFERAHKGTPPVPGRMTALRHSVC